MITEPEFAAALHLLQDVLPFSKAVSPEAKAFLWQVFPEPAKRDLQPADLRWAIEQRLLDPEPPRELALPMVLLHYLYPRRDGRLAFDCGPRYRRPGADPGSPVAVPAERRVFRAGANGMPEPVIAGRGPRAELPAAAQAHQEVVPDVFHEPNWMNPHA